MTVTSLSQVFASTAIPIPKSQRLENDINNNTQGGASYPTTPSLQSILDQKKCSNGSIRSNVSSSSVPSLISTSSSYESCDSHPLDSFNTWDDIDENFFNNNDNNTTTNFEPLSPIEPTKKIISKKASFVSNLSSSIKSFTNSTIQKNDMLFDIQPRLTDDKIPRTTIIQRLAQKDNKVTELQTFKVTSTNSDITTTNSSSNSGSSQGAISILRNREPRINSQFLRLYSYESNSRKKGLLPTISHSDEEEFANNRPIGDSSREFALFVRQRLWQCVVLPPREDLNISPPEYVFHGNNNSMEQISDTDVVSLIRKNGDVKPWIKLEDEKFTKQKVLKPCGVLNNDIQFTVKGWCNERWLPSTTC